MNGSALLIVDLFPSLLQPEGDRGNAVVLAHRARRYGVEATSVVVHPGEEAPPGDIFVIGGSADLDLSACAERLRSSGVLLDAVERGAVVFGVGAGYALLAHSFVDPSGLEVLTLISHGKPNREIALNLAVSENTIKNHVRNIMGKLQVTSRTEAAMHAVRQNLIPAT